MRRILIIASVIALGAMALVKAPGLAQTTPGLQISVQPLIVQFAIAPGQQASTPIVVKNTGSQPAHVTLAQIDWTTNVDGSVKTGRPGMVEGSSLDPYLRLSGGDFDLAPGETKQMTLTLDLPTSFSPAVKDYWGGYFLRAASANGPSGSFGVGANILVYQTVGSPRKHLKLTNLNVEDAGNGNVRLNARMLNDGQTYVRPKIHMEIAQGARIVQARDDSTPAIFAGAPRLYTRTFQGLSSGSYSLALTIDYGGTTLVEGTTQFTVR